MSESARVVIDNNILISRLLLPSSLPAQAVHKALATGQPLTSRTMLEELAAVLARPRFDKYVSVDERRDFLRYWMRIAVIIEPGSLIEVCRDPKDNHVLEAAVNGSAAVVLTGDNDLLALDPFHQIRVLRPADYLKDL